METVRFRMFFGWIKTALIGVIILAGAAIIALDAVMLSGVVPAFTTANTAVAATSLAAAALIDIFAAALLFFSGYTLKEDAVCARMAFFVDRVAYRDIRRISVNADTGEIFAAWCKEGAGPETVTRFNLSAKDAKAMLAELERRCDDVTVDFFTPPEKKKKKD